MADHRGKFLILSIFAAAVALSIFSIFYLRSLRDQAIAFWGLDTALSIRDAEEVDLIWIAPIDEEAPAPEARAADPISRLSGGRLHSAEERRITGAPGLIQMRLALLDNGTFRFDAPLPEKQRWTRGLRFFDEAHATTTLLFDPELALLWHLETDRQVDISPQGEFLKYFLEDAALKAKPANSPAEPR